MLTVADADLCQDNRIGAALEDGGCGLDALELHHCASLRTLDLSFNQLHSLHQLTPLGACAATLRTLSLNDNPVCLQPRYRRTVLAMLPALRELDGVVVSANERCAASAAASACSARGILPVLARHARRGAFLALAPRCASSAGPEEAEAASSRAMLATDVHRADAHLQALEPTRFGEGAEPDEAPTAASVASAVPWSEFSSRERAVAGDGGERAQLRELCSRQLAEQAELARERRAAEGALEGEHGDESDAGFARRKRHAERLRAMLWRHYEEQIHFEPAGAGDRAAPQAAGGPAARLNGGVFFSCPAHTRRCSARRADAAVRVQATVRGRAVRRAIAAATVARAAAAAACIQAAARGARVRAAMRRARARVVYDVRGGSGCAEDDDWGNLEDEFDVDAFLGNAEGDRLYLDDDDGGGMVAGGGGGPLLHPRVFSESHHPSEAVVVPDDALCDNAGSGVDPGNGDGPEAAAAAAALASAVPPVPIVANVSSLRDHVQSRGTQSSRGSVETEVIGSDGEGGAGGAVGGAVLPLRPPAGAWGEDGEEGVGEGEFTEADGTATFEERAEPVR